MKAAYIEWLDSHSTHLPGTWHEPEALSNKITVIYSVGFILKESSKSVTLVSSVTEGQVAGDITIPKVAIIKRKRIKL